MKVQLFPKPGGLNVYTCERCGVKITTVDRDEGTTPFMLLCGTCGGFMESACYPKQLPDDLPEPSFEWIAPSPAELVAYLKTKPKRHHQGIREHVAQGGLLNIHIRRM